MLCQTAKVPAPAPAVGHVRASGSEKEPYAGDASDARRSGVRAQAALSDVPAPLALPDEATQRSAVQSFLYPHPEELPDGESRTPAGDTGRRVGCAGCADVRRRRGAAQTCR